MKKQKYVMMKADKVVKIAKLNCKERRNMIRGKTADTALTVGAYYEATKADCLNGIERLRNVQQEV